MISKADYIWLERHTDILNKVQDIDSLAKQFVKFKIYRPGHLQKIQDIFKDYTCISGKNNKDAWVKIKGLTLENFDAIAADNGGQLIGDSKNKDIYYIPADYEMYHKIIRRSSAKLLANLSNRKKLNILFALAQNLSIHNRLRGNNHDFIEQNSDKVTALLQLKIPDDFMRKEYKKVQAITSKIASLPNIRAKLNKFQLLSKKEQQSLIKEVSRITAEVNKVEPPKVHFITNKQSARDSHIADWVQTDAFADYQDIYINKDLLKSYSGLEALTMGFHETTHVAQSGSDYKDFLEMEDIFSPRLNYLQNYAETYASLPLEMITYNLEQEFCEQLNKKLNLKIKDYAYMTEYSYARMYMQKSLRRAY